MIPRTLGGLRRQYVFYLDLVAISSSVWGQGPLECYFHSFIDFTFELDGDNLKGYYFNDKNTVYKYKIEHKDDRIKDSWIKNFRHRDKHVYTEQHYYL